MEMESWEGKMKRKWSIGLPQHVIINHVIMANIRYATTRLTKWKQQLISQLKMLYKELVPSLSEPGARTEVRDQLRKEIPKPGLATRL